MKNRAFLRSFFQLFMIGLAVLFFGCSKEVNQKQVLQGDAFGTTYTIQFYSETTFDAEKGIDSVLYAVNKSVNTYMPSSDISKINRGDTTVVTDEIFQEVYRISELVYRNSKGFFDPTVGILRNAYGFGDTQPIAEIDSITLDSLRRYVGFQKVRILKDGTVRKQYPQIYFDFNAVAKGYGIDLLGSYLESKGVQNYIIELGGEVLAKGINPSKSQPWIAGVESINSEVTNRNTRELVTLKNQALAASGNYRKFRIDSITGKKYVHTINPHTGKAEQSNVTSAAVIAPSCVLADAYATAFMAMGFENSVSLLPTLPAIEAYLTYTDENNTQQVYATEGFKKLIQK